MLNLDAIYHEHRISIRALQSILHNSGFYNHFTSYPADVLETVLRKYYDKPNIFYKTFDTKLEEVIFVTENPIRESRWTRLMQFIKGE